MLGGGRASQQAGGRRDGRGRGGKGDRRSGGGGGVEGTATAMRAGGCSIGVNRSPEVGDGGDDR